MRFAMFFLFLFSTQIFAQQDQRLSNGHWAYYGEEFYQTLSNKRFVDRTVFNRLYNENHVSVRGKYDTITTRCENVQTCYRHMSVGYENARKIMFGELDTLRDARGTYVLDVYCGKKFYFESVTDVSRMHDRVNIEHTWPQSKFNGNFPKEVQKSDMHHLYLTDSRANSMRGNSPFGFVKSYDNRMGGEGCDHSLYGFSTNGDVYTPPAPHRGNVARAIFYFALRYNMGIMNTEEQILRQWHKEDPIDMNEVRRHEQIARYQKVRNPFVDHPEIVDRISDF